jgi:hypothetical protein
MGACRAAMHASCILLSFVAWSPSCANDRIFVVCHRAFLVWIRKSTNRPPHSIVTACKDKSYPLDSLAFALEQVGENYIKRGMEFGCRAMELEVEDASVFIEKTSHVLGAAHKRS